MSDGPFVMLGLGLIGGSIARDLAAAGAEVWGFDRDRAAMQSAVSEGIITRTLSPELSELAEARFVILAVPVDVAPALLDRARRHLAPAALVTDVGSTKQRIVAHAASVGLGARFVGSHPMAGAADSGWPASRRGLFAGARVDLCADDTVDSEAVAAVEALWRRLGAEPTRRDARAHDAEIALSSHLPQLLSLALAGTLSARGVGRARLGPGGSSMTRLAGSNPEMWTAILDENAAHIADAIDTCQAALGALRGAVARRDRQAVRTVFDTAHAWLAADLRD